MRFFPSAPRLRRTLDRLPTWAHPQWLVTAVAVVVAVAGLAMPIAHADDGDDLKDKQKRVQGQISSVKGEIHEASAKVAKIAGQLKTARSQLATAQARYVKVQRDLVTAQAQSAALATKLAVAEQKLVVAKAELAAAKAKVVTQRREGRDTVILMATTSNRDLALLASYTEGRTMSDVLSNKTSHDVVSGRQQQALDKFVAIEQTLATREAAVRVARNGVATAKKAADENVATIATLVSQAATTKTKVAGLVVTTANARAAVVRARAADRAALERLEKREAAIKTKILALSRKQGGSYNGSTGGLLARPGPGPVTSPYGWRVHPIYGYWGLHNGTDFGTGCGARLVAGESGKVIDTYYDEVYGNRLYLAIGKVNGASITLVYNHMSGYAVGEGDHVRRGQKVGSSGSTGWSTGCHLHFIVLRNGEPTDPMKYL